MAKKLKKLLQIKFLKYWLRFHILYKINSKERRKNPSLIQTLFKEVAEKFKNKPTWSFKTKKNELNIKWFSKERNLKSSRKEVTRISEERLINKRRLTLVRLSATNKSKICLKTLSQDLSTLTIKLIPFCFQSMDSMYLTIFAFWKVLSKMTREKWLL